MSISLNYVPQQLTKLLSYFDCTAHDCCHFTLLTAPRILYVWHNWYLATMWYHSLVLLVNLHHANCFYFTCSRLFLFETYITSIRFKVTGKYFKKSLENTKYITRYYIEIDHQLHDVRISITIRSSILPRSNWSLYLGQPDWVKIQMTW